MGRWLLGILILIIVSGLLSWIGPWNAKARSAEMGQSINQALSSAGYTDLKAEMSGNVATIVGNAKSKNEAAEAIAIAQNAKCPTCPDKEAGKRWHIVKNGTNVAKVVVPTQSPYSFDATKSETGGIVLNGYVNDEAERQKVLAEANRLFPGNVTDRTVRIALGQPNAAWSNVINSNMGELALLDSGELTMRDDQVFLRGRAADEGIRARVNSIVSQMPSGYNGAANISVPNVAALNVGEVTDQNICQTLFNELKGDTKLNFASARAEIRGSDSFNLLNTLSSAANQCASFRIQIDGHTDSQGDAAYNQNLSERRAQTVVAYLRDQGIAVDRMNATGYGETAPIASNDNREGMAQNRRIEFTVTQAK